MYLKAATLDDLMAKVFEKLLKSKVKVKSSKGNNVEVSGVVLELTQPRSRLSRTEVKGTIFSCLGEFFWYLSGSDKSSQMEYYIKNYNDYAEEDGTVRGAYGPRIFEGCPSQYDVVVQALKKKPDTRQAIIQLFDKEDIQKPYKDVPCTCTLQFIQRKGMLNLYVHMRSNDAYLGLPHDIFAFTMMQEIIASELGYKLGTYKHLVGSLHLYDSNRDNAGLFLKEGVQPTSAMPSMSSGDQWPDIKTVLRLEELLRSRGEDGIEEVLATLTSLTPFWADMVRLLAIYALTKGSQGEIERLRQVVKLKNEMSSTYYRTYIRRRSQAEERKLEQLELTGLTENKMGDS